MAREARLLKKHAKGCFAVQAVAAGDWDSPWWMPGMGTRSEQLYRTASGAVGGIHRWRRLECNSSGCGAQMIVSESALARFAGGLLAQSARKPRRALR